MRCAALRIRHSTEAPATIASSVASKRRRSRVGEHQAGGGHVDHEGGDERSAVGQPGAGPADSRVLRSGRPAPSRRRCRKKARAGSKHGTQSPVEGGYPCGGVHR